MANHVLWAPAHGGIERRSRIERAALTRSSPLAHLFGISDDATGPIFLIVTGRKGPPGVWEADAPPSSKSERGFIPRERRRLDGHEAVRARGAAEEHRRIE